MEAEVKDFLAKRHLSVSVVRVGKYGENILDSSTKIKQKIIDKLAK
jgi:glycerol-3-phosphate cytidylyltransferase-like family protein